MREGHIGVKSECIDTKQSHNFMLALSYLEHQRGQGWLVLHVYPRVRVKAGLGPHDFLLMLGFEQYAGACPHLNRPCYFKLTSQVPSKSAGLQLGVPEFSRFVDSIHDLYSLAEDFTRRAGQHSDFVRWGRQFSSEPKVLDFEESEPEWLAELRTEQHREALEALNKAEASVKHFRTIQQCLSGKEQELEQAVQYTLSDLGLDPQKTVEGEHVDLLLEYPRKAVQIGIEVTGTGGSIGMKSSKMNQVAVYLEECEERQAACKGVILANTHSEVPYSERAGLQHFTDSAVKAMKGQGIVGLTTVDLYHIWQDVKSDATDIDTIIGEICEHKGGVYRYPR